MTFRDMISDRAWRILRYQGVGEDMEGIFRDNPWVAACSALVSPVRDYVVSAERDRRHAEQGKIRAEQESLIDPLTGLWNRRAFDDSMPRELRTAFRRMEPLTLALMDIDYFKDLNDISGHSEGDNALRLIGAVMCNSNRADRAYRLGGDEFAVLMSGTGLAGGMKAAGHYKNSIHMSVHYYGLTVSVGIAGYVPQGDPGLARHSPQSNEAVIRPDMEVQFKTLYTSADRALYRAKETRDQPGRSGICAFMNGELVEV